MPLRSKTLKGVAFAMLGPRGHYAEVVCSTRAAINISVGIFPWCGDWFEQVLLSVTPMNMKVRKKKKSADILISHGQYRANHLVSPNN